MPLISLKFWHRAAVVAGTAVAASLAGAAYPERPVQLVAPFPPGGAADVLARILSRELEVQLGQPGVVENKPSPGRT